jgi:DnaJ-class molecular chaperone
LTFPYVGSMGLFRRLGRRVEVYRRLAERTVTELSNARCSACGAWRSPGRGPCPECDYYPPHEVLGVDPGASDDVVKAAAREKLKTAHPDHGGSKRRLQRVKEARDELLDP